MYRCYDEAEPLARARWKGVRSEMGNQIVATYWMETPFDVERAADVVSGEQSSDTFVQVLGETADLKKR